MEIPKLTRVKNSRIFKIKNKDFEYELEITERGFTLWVLEDVDGRRAMHWLIDASLLKEENRIDLAKRNCWNIGLKEYKHPYLKIFKVVKCKSKH